MDSIYCLLVNMLPYIINGWDHRIHPVSSEVSLQTRSAELVSLFSAEKMMYSIYCLLVTPHDTLLMENTSCVQ